MLVIGILSNIYNSTQTTARVSTDERNPKNDELTHVQLKSVVYSLLSN